MKYTLAVLLAVMVVLMSGIPASAHHSFSATYQESETIEIQGAIVQVSFRNPHSWVYVMALDKNGVMHRWGVEWGGVGQLAGQGMTRSSLIVGDEVIITGAPGRNPADHRLRMNTLLRPSDGFSWGTRAGERFN
jgi:hypothetical protein